MTDTDLAIELRQEADASEELDAEDSSVAVMRKAAEEINRLTALVGVQRPEDVQAALELARDALVYVTDQEIVDPAGACLHALNAVDRVLALPHTGQPQTYTEICANPKCPRGGLPVEIVAAPASPRAEGECRASHAELLEAARSAASRLLGYCEQNEAEFTGWGEQIVPPEAEAMTAQAQRIFDAFAPPVIAEERAEDTP